MRVFMDTEFIEDGKTIDLISIGLVCEDGMAYYAISSECDLSRANPWVQKNVLPYLNYGNVLNVDPIPRAVIAAEIVRLVGDKPEFWAYYADYDWVVLCQLFGTMMDLPKGWPMYCRDVKQLCDSIGNPPLPKQIGGTHNALEDAKWARDAWTFLTSQERLINEQAAQIESKML